MGITKLKSVKVESKVDKSENPFDDVGTSVYKFQLINIGILCPV